MAQQFSMGHVRVYENICLKLIAYSADVFSGSDYLSLIYSLYSTLRYTNSSLLKMAIEIVSFPTDNGDVPMK